MITNDKLVDLAAAIEDCFPALSFSDIVSVISEMRKLEEFKDINELRKAAFQYAQRLENS